MDKCRNHPERDAHSTCHSCQAHFCKECLVEGPTYYYCTDDACQVAYREEMRVLEEKSTSLNVKERMEKFIRNYWFLFYGWILVQVVYVAVAYPKVLGTIIGFGVAYALIGGLILRWMLNGLRKLSTGWRTWFLVTPWLAFLYNLRDADVLPGLTVISELVVIGWGIYLYSFLLDREIKEAFESKRQSERLNRLVAAPKKAA